MISHLLHFDAGVIPDIVIINMFGKKVNRVTLLAHCYMVDYPANRRGKAEPFIIFQASAKVKHLGTLPALWDGLGS